MKVIISKFLIVTPNHRNRMKNPVMDKLRSFSTWVGAIEDINLDMTQ